MASERGEYRLVYVALVDGPDFCRLSKWARALWYPIKLTLGPLGLAAVPGAVNALAERSGFTPAEVEEATQELEREGWVMRQGNMWWMVRGLEFEPSINPNDRKHRAFVRREWAKLPNLPIRNEFRQRYAGFFVDEGEGSEGASKGLGRGIEGASMGHRSTSPSPSPFPSPSPAPSPAGDDTTEPPFEDPSHRDAYTGFLTAARSPRAVAATIKTVAEGMPGHGEGFPWPVIGEALVELAAAGSTFSANGLRAFARQIVNRPKPPRPALPPGVEMVTDELGREVPQRRDPTSSYGWRPVPESELDAWAASR